MAITTDDAARLENADVMGRDGKKLGAVDAVYYDNDTNQPEWVSVKTGMFGKDVSLVPLASAGYDGNKGVTVPYDKEALRSAPHHDPGRELTPQDEDELFRHYGIGYGGVGYGRETSGNGRQTTGDGQAGEAARRSTEDTMTRSEERLRVGTETRETGKARLRKRVVTEHQQVNVPVSHEEVRVEREPITDANRDATGAPTISEEEREVTLHAERPVVHTEAEAVERVRLGTEKVQDTEEVGGDVRREEIDVDEGDRNRDTKRR